MQDESNKCSEFETEIFFPEFEKEGRTFRNWDKLKFSEFENRGSHFSNLRQKRLKQVTTWLFSYYRKIRNKDQFGKTPTDGNWNNFCSASFANLLVEHNEHVVGVLHKWTACFLWSGHCTARKRGWENWKRCTVHSPHRMNCRKRSTKKESMKPQSFQIECIP